MKSFRRGLRSRNPLVLVVALALIVPVLVGAQSYFASGRWTDVPLEHWLRTAGDDYSYVSGVVGSVKRDPPQKPSLFLLGGSSARESIVSGASFPADVKREGGPDVAAWDLGTMNQSFAQSLAVADNVLLVRARQRGLHAVLVELPLNRGIVGDRFDDAIAEYRAPIEALAAEYRVPYIDFNRDLRIPDGDFHDLSHLTEPGRVIWQRRLAGEVVKIMGEDARASGESQ